VRREYLHQLPLVEDAYARRALALLRQLDTACANAEDLATATITLFRIHPDATIITNQPGLGELTGARVRAEIGDDPTRFSDARGLKAYAGSAPVHRIINVDGASRSPGTWSWLEPIRPTLRSRSGVARSSR
jgi:transposase